MFRAFVVLSALLFTHSAFAERYVVDQGLSITVTDSSATLETSTVSTPRSERVENPPRFVVDVPKLQGRRSPSFTIQNNPHFSGVRIGRHSDFTRVVFDLKHRNSQMKVAARNKVITVEPESTAAHLAEVKPLAAERVAVEKDRSESASTSELALRFSLNRMVVSFPFGGRPVADVVVKNESAQTLFMTTSTQEVVHPGTPQQEKVSTTALLASPRRFEIKPSQERTVRLLLATGPNPSEERVFRVNFIPDGEPFQPNKEEKPVSVAAGIAMLVLAEPSKPEPKLNWEWKNEGLLLENLGNANVLLDRGSVCAMEECFGLPAQRLYPGNRWMVSGDALDSAQFLQKSGDAFQQIAIKRDRG